MDWKKLLRVAVCLVLVCTLLIGISPIRAKAVVIETVLAQLTPYFCYGVLAWLILTSAGQVFEPPDIKFIEDLGEGWEREIYNYDYGSSGSGGDDERDEDLENLKKFYSALRTVLNDKGKITKDVLADLAVQLPFHALSTFIAYCIHNGYFEGSSADVTDGFVDTLSVYIPSLDETRLVSKSASYPDDKFYPEPIVFSYSCVDSSGSIYYYSGCLAAHTAPSCTVNGSFRSYEFKSDFYYSYISDISGISESILTSYDDVDGLHFGPYHFDSVSARDDFLSSFDLETSPSYRIEPDAEIGPIVEGIKTGALTAADIPVPEVVDLSSIFAGIEIDGLEAVRSNMVNEAQNIVNGTTSLEDFRQSITYVPEEDSGDDSEDPTEVPGATDGNEDPDDPGSDSGDSEEIPADSTFANFPVLNFFARLGQLLQDIMDGNLLGVKSFFEPWLSGIRKDISNVDSSVQQGFQDVVDSNQGIMDSVQDVVESNQQLQDINEQIAQEQNNIISQGFASVAGTVAGGISSAFVPSDGFFEEKVNDLCDEYAFAGSIAATAKDMKSFLMNLGSVPPVIRINLGAATGDYNYGGDMVLVDFSFYEPYKPQMDAILSAFLWLWFCWRVILNLPGIISGASGVVGSFSDASGVGSRGYIELPNVSFGQASSASPVPESVREHRKKPDVGVPGGSSHYEAWRAKMAKEDKDKF